MAPAAHVKRALPGLSRELNEPRPDPGRFEDIPKIPTIAGDSKGLRMSGKVVIVTGANSPLGIGRAACHHFANTGARAVYVTDFSDTHLATHKRELESLYPGVAIHTHCFDATDEAAVRGVCDDAVARYGRLDVMFANAGIVSHKHFRDLDADEFMHMMKGNLLSVFLCAKYAAAAMLKTSKDKPFAQGSIVATASCAGIRSNAGAADYSAAKAGVISLAQTMAYQLMGTGVRMNAICPGIIETGMTSAMYDMARARGSERKIGQLNPLQRGGVADEVARVALFLASDEASYVNGQAWAVDGGLSAGHPFVPGKMA